MTLMVESVGFSGTHFCAGVINSIPKHIAFHATRNPYQQTDIGINDLSPNELVKRGCIQVMEGRHVFEHLTVEENF